MKLSGQIIKVNELTEQQVRQMFDVFEKYYENADQARFLNDLKEKQWAIILSEDPGSGIVGFSTMMLMRDNVDGREIEVLFSGDTIIDRKFWGSTELPHVWGKFVLDLMKRQNAPQLYWMLITKGYRTYHFLPLFFNEFYPRYDQSIPDSVRRVMDAFAMRKFPMNYSSEKGVISFNGQKEYLKNGIGDIRDPMLKDSHIEFFVKKNPRYLIGDELVCLAELTPENFKPAAYRMIFRGENRTVQC